MAFRCPGQGRSCFHDYEIAEVLAELSRPKYPTYLVRDTAGKMHVVNANCVVGHTDGVFEVYRG